VEVLSNFVAVEAQNSGLDESLVPELFGTQRLERSLAWRWVFIALLGFIAAQVISAGVLYAVAAVKGQSSHVGTLAKLASPPQWFVLASLVGIWIGFIGAPLVAARLDGRRSLGFTFRWVDASGIGIGLVSQVLITLAYRPFLKHIKDFSGPVHKLTGSSHGLGLWIIVAFTVIGAPIAEELFFRGLLYRGLEGSIAGGRGVAYVASSLGAIVIDAALFGAAHMELVQFAGLAVFGVVLASVFRLTGRLGMAIVSHATFNALAIVSLVSSGSIVWLR
jgi:hypothetical protein